jgi:hypothetical protein
VDGVQDNALALVEEAALEHSAYEALEQSFLETLAA